MPFKSDKQRKFLFAKRPELAKEFAEKEKQHKALKHAMKKKAK